MFNLRQFVTYIVLLVNLFFTTVSGVADFGYNGEKGPDHWNEKYASCVGKHQSPININARDVTRVSLMPLKFKNIDVPLEGGKVINNGHTVKLQFHTDHSPSLTGGLLRDEYIFSQLHFHWGDDDNIGSENKINNISFPMELHMVFYKTTYDNEEKALSHMDGLTVLSFLYEISPNDNTNYSDFIDILPQVQQVGMTTSVPNSLTLSALMGADFQKYYTYDGSLTTPPCSEVVQWIEFEKTIPLSHYQIEQFRKLYDEEGYMKHNFRPVQPVNDRPIFYNDGNISTTKLDSSASYLQLNHNIFFILIFLKLYLYKTTE